MYKSDSEHEKEINDKERLNDWANDMRDEQVLIECLERGLIKNIYLDNLRMELVEHEYWERRK